MSRRSARRALGSPRRRLEAIELPKGAVAALCAVVLALPAGLALAHSAKLDSQGRWVHHHTTAYAFCNNIDQDPNLRAEATNARNQWDDASAVLTFPWRAECHEGPGTQANIQLQDGYLGNTGWRSSAINDANGQNLGYHATHTHVHFNLDSYWGAYGNYDRRALVCRELGQVIGVERVWASQYSAHGINNDCMSFAANPNDQVSKIENQNNYTYTDRPGAHAVDLIDRQYADHVAPTLALSGPLVDAQTSTLTDDVYDLWIEAESLGSPARVKVTVDAVPVLEISKPCVADDEQCTEDIVFEFEPTAYAAGSHTVVVTATNDQGIGSSRSLTTNVGQLSSEDEEPLTTPAPIEGSGPGCAVLGIGTQEEGTALVVNGSWSGGAETTEYFGPDEYAIHRCTTAGDLAVSQTVETVAVGSGAEVTTVDSETRPTGELEPSPDGSLPVYKTISATTVDPATTMVSDWDSPVEPIAPTPTTSDLTVPQGEMMTAASAECSQGMYRLAVDRSSGWRFNPEYYVRTATLPHGAKTKRRIINGHAVWNRTKDGCGMRDRTAIRMIYSGRVGDAHTARHQHDRVDVVDFGPLDDKETWGVCSRPATIGCRTFRFARRGSFAGQIIEADIRLEAVPNDRAWWSGLSPPPGDRLDVWSVIAHEAGHKLGLAHPNDENHENRGSAQTMFGMTQAGSARQRDLGRGDVRGLRRLYRGIQPGPDPRPRP